MRIVLNVIWLVLCGVWLAIGYALAALICFLLIVTIPFGVASLRMANYALWPFGRRVVDKPTAGTASLVGNVLWIVLAGWWLALGHLTTGVALCLTIIGIPLGLANFKLIPVSLMPLGKDIVPVDSHDGDPYLAGYR
ncbi:YccF domain-containing protein [Parafrankia discariae]|uniref:YccF domain-containing protein n=1 Tax=Parafrankia discariae TaxID=365528 RepID=UPI0003699B1B|nr:YccF domain-containing protein [Parafrankia discariae]